MPPDSSIRRHTSEPASVKNHPHTATETKIGFSGLLPERHDETALGDRSDPIAQPPGPSIRPIKKTSGFSRTSGTRPNGRGISTLHFRKEESRYSGRRSAVTEAHGFPAPSVKRKQARPPCPQGGTTAAAPDRKYPPHGTRRAYTIGAYPEDGRRPITAVPITGPSGKSRPDRIRKEASRQGNFRTGETASGRSENRPPLCATIRDPPSERYATACRRASRPKDRTGKAATASSPPVSVRTSAYRPDWSRAAPASRRYRHTSRNNAGKASRLPCR